ncbi:HEAT repeat domain-containing protein [Parachlamydia sp. AcF125]|uniref:HEAT repeat domain-containing protein n=1 Tax=Parachlamydia sp. AcF125 TaxID=2795736 RepID=UPI001BC9479C|nr:HEAT repeat domain-containing protein [Parachlamydia sp. AcF125]MBS4168608.1 Avirulence protein AvrBs3 [Parachlamydia sp. AcF125]
MPIKNVNFLLKADQVSDYIPVISTLTNLIDLFQKYVVLSRKQKVNVSKNHYYAHLQQKSFSRCIVLLIPVIGNILVAIYDFTKGRPNYADATLVAAQPTPLSTPKPTESARPPKPTRKGIAIDIDREVGEHAESLVLGTSEARAKGGVYKKHSRALVAAGYPAETALKLALAKKHKKKVISLAEQSSFGNPDYCEPSLGPDLQTKFAFNTPRASAKNFYLEEKAKLNVQTIIQYNGGPSLSQAELDPEYLVSFLRNHYLSQKTISIFRIKTPQEGEFKVRLEEIYVRLGIIENKERKTRDQALDKHSNYTQDERIPTYETIFEPKQEIELEKLFEHESLQKENAKKIYLQGSAGSGKSTLCHYISYRWAKGELWQGIFACLFWIPLRNLTLSKYPEDKDYTPADLIAREYKGKIDRRVIDFCLKDPAFREKTLLILDGYDELSAGAQGNSSLATAFKELKELFPHILITSRPGRCFFKRSCDLELLGFDKKGVDCYIDKFFTQDKAEEKKEKLRLLLKSSPQVSSLARIPMLLILLCCLFHEDPKFFDSNHPITMTAIYERMINWMYQRFLLRRIGQDPSSPTQEHILTEENLRQNSEVSKIATAFEEMANFAMEKDTLYLNKREIVRFSKENEISSHELTDCGILRIPEAEEKGYFIHLTFQEFLTASKVAKQYLKGERQACQNFVWQYKFEPRYSLVLRMIAGYLSLATSSDRKYLNSGVLQSFFDDLFSEPHDLAVRSELNLIAECFEECQNPAIVRQYTGFIKLMESYITCLSSLGLDFGRLIRNRNLFNHPKVMYAIGELLSNPQTKENVLSNLGQIMRTGQKLPPEIVRLITKFLKNSDDDSTTNAGYILKAAVEQGEELPKETIDAFIQILKGGKEGDVVAISCAADALGEVVQQGGKFAKEAVDALIQALRKGNPTAKNIAACVLGKVAQQAGRLAKEAITALTQLLINKSDFFITRRVILDLTVMVNQGGEFAREALDALIQILSESRGFAKDSAASTLIAIVDQGGEFVKEALVALIRILQENDFHTKMHIADALGAVAQIEGKLPKKAPTPQVLQEDGSNAKRRVADALGIMTGQESNSAKKMLDVFAQVFEEGDPNVKRCVADALGIMIGQEDNFAKEALNILLQILRKDDSEAKRHAIRALGIGANLGGNFAKEALDVLLKILKDDNSEVKRYAIYALACQGCKLPSEALNALIQIHQESDSGVKISVASALKAIAHQGYKLPKEALDALIQILKENNFDAKLYAADALVTAAQQKSEDAKEAFAALIQVLKEGDSEAKKRVIHALRTAAHNRGKFSKEVLVAVIPILQGADSLTKTSVANVLAAAAVQGDELPKEALVALIQILQTEDPLPKGCAIDALQAVAKRGDELSDEALIAVTLILKKGNSDHKRRAANVLRVVAEQGGKLPKEVLVVAIQTLKEDTSILKGCAIETLGALAKREENSASEALDVLIQILKEDNSEAKGYAIPILVAVVERGGNSAKEALSALIQILKEGNLDDKGHAAHALRTVAQQGYKLPREALDALIQILKENNCDAKRYAAHALAATVKQRGEDAKEALSALIQILKEGDSEAKNYVIHALGSAAHSRGKLSKEVLVAVIPILQGADSLTKTSVVNVLAAAAEQGDELPKEALVALIQILQTEDYVPKGRAIDTLQAVAKRGGKLAKKVLAALIQILKEGDSDEKWRVASVLRVVAEQGDELPEEGLVTLIQILQEDVSAVNRHIAYHILTIVNRNALLKMGIRVFPLIARVCFFAEDSLSLKGQRFQISDKRITYSSRHKLKLSYKKIRKKLPLELVKWRKQLDSLGPTKNT